MVKRAERIKRIEKFEFEEKDIKRIKCTVTFVIEKPFAMEEPNKILEDIRREYGEIIDQKTIFIVEKES